MDTPTLIGTGLLILGAVVWIVCIVKAYQIAPKRHRSAGAWAFLALIFGPLALFGLMALPVAPQPGQKHRD
jgi:hypothetical protein